MGDGVEASVSSQTVDAMRRGGIFNTSAKGQGCIVLLRTASTTTLEHKRVSTIVDRS